MMAQNWRPEAEKILRHNKLWNTEWSKHISTGNIFAVNRYARQIGEDLVDLLNSDISDISKKFHFDILVSKPTTLQMQQLDALQKIYCLTKAR